MAEASAARDGLLLDQQMGHHKIILQSDCAQVIETLQYGGFSSTASSAIFHECSLIASSFDDVCSEYCPWEANSVAHDIVRSSANSAEFVGLNPVSCGAPCVVITHGVAR